jgi:hypothetical protein
MSEEARPGTGAVFINYRTEDTGESASALARELGKFFGPDKIFIDHLGIRAGTSFPRVIQDALDRARVMLALIGKSWLAVHDEYGVRRIDLPDDWVRRELEHALRGPAVVLPVYVEQAHPVPAAAFQTTPSLAGIAGLQGLPLRRRSWQPDVTVIRERIAECGISVVQPPVARATLDLANILSDTLTSQSEAYRRASLVQLESDLESVHTDYLAMFESILEQMPDPWEQGSREFSDRIRATAIQLQRLRISYEPVRVRVRATAKIFSALTYPGAEKEFIRKVLAYFPNGEMRFEDTAGRNSTSATALLEHLLRSPDGPGSQELHGAVRSTLRLHRDRWAQVCDAYARLQVFWGVTP